MPAPRRNARAGSEPPTRGEAIAAVEQRCGAGCPGEGHWAHQWYLRYVSYLHTRRRLAPRSVQNYLADLDTFWRFLDRQGVKALGEAGLALLRGYLHWLLAAATPRSKGSYGQRANYSGRSVARKLSALRSFFRFLAKEGAVDVDPTARLASAKLERRLPDFVDHQGARRLVEAPQATTPLGMRDRALLELLYAAGLRVSEVVGLDLGRVDLERAEVRVLGKGSKERLALLGRPAQEALRQYVEQARPRLLGRRSGEALFLNRFGGRLSQRGVQALVKRYALLAGLDPSVHTHTMRHTFATHLLDGGADLRVVQELLGHASPATTQVYTHVTQAQARRVYLAAHPRARRRGPSS
ncbi:MAG: tyrosine recombinase XerC [Chloroflexi bacterium]|nr:tyrosine recombinase XerC [Chloroflexota bacterium]